MTKHGLQRIASLVSHAVLTSSTSMGVTMGGCRRCGGGQEAAAQ